LTVFTTDVIAAFVQRHSGWWINRIVFAILVQIQMLILHRIFL